MKSKPLVIVLLLANCAIVSGQEKVKMYYNSAWEVITHPDSGGVVYYREFTFNKEHKPVGKIKDYYVTGEIQSETEGALYIDTLDDHKSIFIKNSERYYKSGKKQSETKRDDQGKILSDQGWNEDGTPRYFIPYKDGKKNGVKKNYNIDGTLMSEIPYIDDSIDGTVYHYYHDKTVMSETHYSKGKEVGIAKTYYLDGPIKSERLYNNGIKEGIWKGYYFDGKVQWEMPYLKGTKNGIETGYYENGQKEYTETWVNDTITGTRQTFYANGKLKEEVPYVMNKHEGMYKLYDSTAGRLMSTYDYAKGKLNGYVTQYWDNGKLKRKDKYEDDSLMSGECYDSSGKQVPYHKYDVEIAGDPVLTIVQVMPKFPGNVSEYLSNKIHYPEYERKKNITGTVYINFIVEKDGSVSNVRVLKGVPNGLGLDNEAVRVVSGMPKWTPGTQNGRPVRVSYNIPIRFALQ